MDAGARWGGVLFDLDGTLLDTLDDLAGAMNRALVAGGWAAHPVAAYRRFVGDGAGMLARRALPPGAPETAAQAVLAAFMADYQGHWHDQTRPYLGVVEMLSALAAQGVPTAVLSNKPDRYVAPIMRHFFPGHAFAVAAGQRPGVARKPDPAGALAVAQEMGVEPGRILYLGDSDVDVRTATAAGMEPCGALWGFRGREELLASGARRLAARPGEVLEWARERRHG